MSIANLTYESFDAATKVSDKPVLVDFWAEWCGPCKMMLPVLEQFSEEQDKIAVAKVDADEAPQLVMAYQITSIPTMLLFVDGEPVKQITGAKPKAALLKELEEYL